MDEDTIPDALTPEQRYEQWFTELLNDNARYQIRLPAAPEPYIYAADEIAFGMIRSLRDMLASRDAELDRLTDDNRRMMQRIERLERAR